MDKTTDQGGAVVRQWTAPVGQSKLIAITKESNKAKSREKQQQQNNYCYEANLIIQLLHPLAGIVIFTS